MHATKDQRMRLSRLNEQTAFDILRKTKLRWVSQSLALQAAPKYSGKRPRGDGVGYCIIASKKTAKKAVDRNLMRRRLRNLAAEILPRHGRDDMDYMVIARSGALQNDYEKIRGDLVWCLKNLDRLDRQNSQQTTKPDANGGPHA